jgi:hypothetical protein
MFQPNVKFTTKRHAILSCIHWRCVDHLVYLGPLCLQTCGNSRIPEKYQRLMTYGFGPLGTPIYSNTKDTDELPLKNYGLKITGFTYDPSDRILRDNLY